MRDPWAGEVDNILDHYDQMAKVAERSEVMTGTRPWYWTDARYDHWAVGLVACAGDNERIHYSGVGRAVRTACEINQQPANVRLLEGPRIVDCRLCAAVAQEDRDLIDQRHVQPIIKSHDRVNFVRREQARRKHG